MTEKDMYRGKVYQTGDMLVLNNFVPVHRDQVE